MRLSRPHLTAAQGPDEKQRAPCALGASTPQDCRVNSRHPLLASPVRHGSVVNIGSDTTGRRHRSQLRPTRLQQPVTGSVIQPDMTTPSTNDELQTQQRKAQQLLGRCLLRLQQYERLIKAIVAHHEISGPTHAIESIRVARIADTASKTLGTLVGTLLGSYVIAEGVETSNRVTTDAPEDVISFGMRIQLSLSAEDYAQTENGLKELVLLRNNLVHHFIDQHDLWSLDGCRGADEALVAAYSRIDQHFEQLRGWAEHTEQARRLAAEFVQSDAFHDLVINGIAPDGTLDWPASGIVSALRGAAAALAVEGWTPVALAGGWIAENHPEQLPAKYGCSSWRQVVHESRLFELRYREMDRRRAAWYRAKEA